MGVWTARWPPGGPPKGEAVRVVETRHGSKAKKCNGQNHNLKTPLFAIEVCGLVVSVAPSAATARVMMRVHAHGG